MIILEVMRGTWNHLRALGPRDVRKAPFCSRNGFCIDSDSWSESSGSLQGTS